ncbi:MAG: arginine--tRNA ligase [Bacteroidota bacterium]
MNPLKEQLAQYLVDAIRQLGIDKNADQMVGEFRTPPNRELGHLSFPCFVLSKELKKATAQIAVDLLEILPDHPLVRELRIVNAYLNFFLQPREMGRLAMESILKGDFFALKPRKELPKTMIEYSQPNTHKELHVGHMRNLCLGNTLVKLHRYCGYEIISSTFPGDVGTHVAKCLWYLKYHNEQPMPSAKKGEWLGRMYSKGHLKLEESDDPQEQQHNKKQLSQILTQLEKGEGDFFDLWETTRQWSIDQMEEVYQWAEVTFDKWYWESEVDVPSLEWIKSLYGKGHFVKSKGVIGMDLSEHDLGFCVLIKSDGHGLYATKDIELARRKFEDYQIEKNIYVVDERQSHHFAQVFKTLELMGYENAKYCYHLAYNYVELPDGPMSSRKGNIIPIMALINQMEEKVFHDLNEKYGREWSEEDKQKIATIIAKGAIKYGMLKIDANKKIVFDMKGWLDLNGDSGPYLQYVYTRIHSLCQKQEYDPSIKTDWQALTNEMELRLLLQLSDFNTVVRNACQGYKPNLLCNYLFDLAKSYNSFYNSCPVAKAPSQAIKQARLSLSSAVGLTMEKGLDLLGIPVPEKM